MNHVKDAHRQTTPITILSKKSLKIKILTRVDAY